ncbi:hypothetical protein Nmel_006611 [Mimus melanotis]
MKLQRSYFVLVPDNKEPFGASLARRPSFLFANLWKYIPELWQAPTFCTVLFQKKCPSKFCSPCAPWSLSDPGRALTCSSKHDLTLQQPLISPEVLLQDRVKHTPTKGFAAAEKPKFYAGSNQGLITPCFLRDQTLALHSSLELKVLAHTERSDGVLTDNGEDLVQMLHMSAEERRAPQGPLWLVVKDLLLAVPDAGKLTALRDVFVPRSGAWGPLLSCFIE